MAPVGLKLGENESYGLQGPFKTLPALHEPVISSPNSTNLKIPPAPCAGIAIKSCARVRRCVVDPCGPRIEDVHGFRIEDCVDCFVHCVILVQLALEGLSPHLPICILYIYKDMQERGKTSSYTKYTHLLYVRISWMCAQGMYIHLIISLLFQLCSTSRLYVPFCLPGY